MTDVHQQNAHLKSQIDTGAREATVYLEKLKENVTEFDQKNKLPHTAAEYLNSGISTAESSIVELKDVAAHMSDKSEDKSEETMETARNSLQKVKDSLDSLQSTAREYDQKFMNGGGAETAGGIMKSVENLTNAARQRTTDAIEMASEQLTRMKDSVQNAASTAGYGVQVAVGEAARLGEKVDNTLGVSSVAASAAGGVSGTVKNLDKRLHVSETAANIDEKVTGGLGAKVMHKGVEMVHDSIEYISETLQQAKIAAGKSSTAQDVEGRATATGQSISQSVSDTTGAAGERMTAAKDQAAGMVLGARDRTLEMGTSAKQSVMNAAGMSTDRPATEQLKEGAYNAKDTAAYKTGDIRQSARETAGSAQQTGHDLKESVKEGAYNAKESAKEGAYNAKDTAAYKTGDIRQSARETADSARQEGATLTERLKEGAYSAKDTIAAKLGDLQQGAYEMAGSAQQEGHDLKESAKEGAYNAKDKAAYKTGDIRQSARETAGSAQQTGHHLKEGAKEGAYNAKEGAKEGAYNAKEGAKEGAYNARNKADEQGNRATSEGYSQGYGTQQPSTFDYVKDKAKEMGTYAKETALGPGESATDQKRHEKRHEELYGAPSSGRHL